MPVLCAGEHFVGASMRNPGHFVYVVRQRRCIPRANLLRFYWRLRVGPVPKPVDVKKSRRPKPTRPEK